MEDSPYLVLLYYLYVELPDPETYRDEHYALCERLGLKGRIIIAKEGINGTVSGTKENCEEYMRIMHDDPLTSSMTFKIDEERKHAFPKLSVKARNEIVTLGLGDDDFSPTETTGKHLTPEQWQETMQEPGTVILDARNDYEYDLGHFKKAIRPDIGNFKELPEWIRKHRDQLEGKKILTYCTGGIRCEKFSGFLVKEGFHDVNQLLGGIVEYGKDPKVRGKDYDGECYVFDQRVSVPINRVNPEIVSMCKHCGSPCQRYINCAHPPCNAQHFCCEQCEPTSNRYCCSECKTAAEESRQSVEGQRVVPLTHYALMRLSRSAALYLAGYDPCDHEHYADHVF